MAKFDFLKEYVFSETDERASTSKHAFYALTKQDVIEAEERLGRKFPKELRQFYAMIGYGFLCADDDEMIDRVMDPGSVADFKLGEGVYEFDPERDAYGEEELPFFEVSETTYISLDVSQEDENGICPVYYVGTKIAESLEEFFKNMDNQTDYYLTLD